MKHFHDETIAEAEPGPAAEALVLLAAHVMRDFREEIRRRPHEGLTFSQLRALGYLKGSAGASLSDVAEYLGLGAPTTSKLIEDLVRQENVRRETAAEDRRRVTLHITPKGRRALQVVRGPAVEVLAQRLATLSAEERTVVLHAIHLLQPLFTPGGAGEREEEG